MEQKPSGPSPGLSLPYNLHSVLVIWMNSIIRFLMSSEFRQMRSPVHYLYLSKRFQTNPIFVERIHQLPLFPCTTMLRRFGHGLGHELVA